jgi:DNA-binding response OmpR family regulator
MGFAKQRVLIMDDDPEQLLLVGRTLRAAGYDVEMVTTPIGITNVARRIQPDIIMLDVTGLGYGCSAVA